MRLTSGTPGEEDCHGGYVTIGNFDGVHLGHAAIVTLLVEKARAAGVPAIVLTFDPHPILLLRPEMAPPGLTTLEERAGWLEALGVDAVVVYPTTPEMLALEPKAFFEQVVGNQLGAVGLVEGPNFCFGRGRSGTIETLEDLCRDAGLPLEVVPPQMIGDQLISSSKIRELLKSGAVAEAAEMLGRRHQVRGTVRVGEGRGRMLGVPTANLEGVETLIPSAGVYVGCVRRDERVIPAAVNIGGNPTFGEDEQKLEVHLVDFDEDLYGQELGLEFCQRLRGVVSFDGVTELKEQLQRDIERVRQWSGFAEH